MLKRFKRQQYERPLGKYKCGRAACWDKPCFSGPKADGTCGGAVECTPFKRGDRWECTRPAAAGGPCANGPLPDGKCSCMQPPCVPVLTLRAKRGRLVIFACLVLITGLICWFHFGGRGTRIAALQPGPLSARHQHLAALILGKDGQKGSGGDDENCSVCHRAHSAGAGGFIAAAFEKSEMSSQCLNCHRFANPADQALQNTEHNEIFPNREHAAKTECQICHTEHHGLTASLIAIKDSQCNTCHTTKIKSFSNDHPQFPDDFPLIQINPIRFDHNKHEKEYFKQKSADFKCAECHKAESSQKQMETGSFEENCARCHATQIAQNDLVLVRLSAGNTAMPPTPFNNLLLGSGQNTAFLKDLAKSGNVLQTRLQTASGVADLKELFVGLDLKAVAQVAGLMAKATDPTAVTIPPNAGGNWYWNTDNDDSLPELHYRATTHADAIMHAWLDFSVRAPSEFQKTMLNRTKGAGNCAKCHVTTSGETAQIGWRFRAPQTMRHTTFAHSVHLKLLDCATCHELNGEAKLATQYAADANIVQISTKPVSSFKSIQIQTCTKCHGEKKISQDCFLCHRYHNAPSFKHPGETLPTLQVMNHIVPKNSVAPPAEAVSAPATPTLQAPPQPSAEDQAKEKAAKEQAAKEQAAKEQAAKQQAAEQAAKDQAAKTQAAKEEALKEEVAREQAAKQSAVKPASTQQQNNTVNNDAAKNAAARDHPAVTASAVTPVPTPAPVPRSIPPPAPATAPATTPPAAPASSTFVAIPRAPKFHGNFIGNQECISCHGSENEVWAATKHNKSWDLRRMASKAPVPAILAAVGSSKSRPQEEPICMSCHFTVVDNKAALGVSCESCHGAASDWKDVHNNKDAIPDKATRMEAARQKGMIGPTMKQDLIQNCFGCHNYDSGNVSGETIAKMLGAGHPAFAFEFVQFSQGTVRHRFYPPDTTVNSPMTPAELARWYVVGQGAQLVSSARVLAASVGVESIKNIQLAQIDKASKALTATGLPEAQVLITAPTDDNLSRLISATEGKDFTSQVGGMLPPTYR